MFRQSNKCAVSLLSIQAGKKCAAPKCQGEKRCEIKGGGQEMAVIIVQWPKKFNNDKLK